MDSPDVIKPDSAVSFIRASQITLRVNTWRGLFAAVAFARRELDRCADLDLERALRRAA